MWHNPTKWGAFSRSLGNGFTWRFYLTFTPQTQHQDGEVLHSQGLLAVTFTFFQAKSARSGADVVTNFHGEAYNSVFSPLLPHHTSMHTQSFSCVQLFVTPWPVACQAPLSMGILQARILEWVAIPSSMGSSQPRDQTQVSCIAGRFFTIWAMRGDIKISFF